MTVLWSYCLRWDDGAAPNPYWGVCTLNICKPKIRRLAGLGDWVVGTGSANSPIGDIRNRLVYAMRVTAKKTMPDYDGWVQSNRPEKEPDFASLDPSRWLGDSVYDFAIPDAPRRRDSVHDQSNQELDLSGRFTLLSDDFYYLGNQPVELPKALQPIIQFGQGHRSNANAAYLPPFLKWIRSAGLPHNIVETNPQYAPNDYPPWNHPCAAQRLHDDQDDQTT
jgi:hypothetical protein